MLEEECSKCLNIKSCLKLYQALGPSGPVLTRLTSASSCSRCEPGRERAFLTAEFFMVPEKPRDLLQAKELLCY